MEQDLPEDLMLMVNNKLIEILWVYENYKSLKKILFTIQKYKNIPVISADDDCIYTCNYAEILYNEWKKHARYSIIRYTKRNTFNTQGPCTLYSIKPEDINGLIKKVESKKFNLLLDDDFYSNQFKRLKYRMFHTGKTAFPFIFHDVICPITKNQKHDPIYRGCFAK